MLALLHNRLVLALFFGGLVVLSPCLDQKAAAETSQQDEALLDDDTVFIIGNTLFTVYHELGHALIDLLNLPVIGREEDAVDGFAAVTMIPEAPDLFRDSLIVAVADGWRVLGDWAAEGREERPYWGEHALDEQRHFAVVCLMVGSDQDGFYDYALDAGLPEERIETCIDDFERMKSGWRRLLGPYKRASGKDDVTAASPISMVFEKPNEDQAWLYDILRHDGLLEAAVNHLAETIVLPSPVTVRFAPCNDANAYWTRDEREVTICYELVDEFEAILSGALVR